MGNGEWGMGNGEWGMAKSSSSFAYFAYFALNAFDLDCVDDCSNVVCPKMCANGKCIGALDKQGSMAQTSGYRKFSSNRIAPLSIAIRTTRRTAEGLPNEQCQRYS